MNDQKYVTITTKTYCTVSIQQLMCYPLHFCGGSPVNRPSDVSGSISDSSERWDESFEKTVMWGEPALWKAECVLTHRYWPPESTRYISSTVSLRAASLVGLQQHTETGNKATLQRYTYTAGNLCSGSHFADWLLISWGLLLLFGCAEEFLDAEKNTT